MARREFPRSVKLAAFQRAKGRCEAEGCGAKLMPGHYRYDHQLPDGLGGKPTLENCQVLCDDCDGPKTYGRDIPMMAKADRIKRKRERKKKRWLWPSRAMAGSRKSGVKHRMDGTWERRQ
jgi:5-methylcytosine-specific restriction protein A